MKPLALVVAVVFLAGCGDGTEPTPPATTAAPSPATTEAPAELDFSAPETVVSGLEVPWEIAFVDETRMLVTERPGRVRVIEGGRLREEPAATIAVLATGEAGLLGLAVRDGFAYVYYTAPGGNRVSRFPLGDDFSFGDEEVLLDGIPAAPFHDGGRIAFGPDDMLYVTTGDATVPESAADRGSLSGKILRLPPEGGEPEVWSFGHRDPQGLAWADDGTMYAAEHGPSGELGLCCHDEVNVVEQGVDYGWPEEVGASEGAGAPLAESGDETWAPAGAAWFDGSLYVATLAGERLLRISPEGQVETAFDGLGRLRIAAVGPDGCLYVGTSNRDGRGNPAAEDDRIVRFCPR